MLNTTVCMTFDLEDWLNEGKVTVTEVSGNLQNIMNSAQWRNGVYWLDHGVVSTVLTLTVAYE